jgi:hypothetical protein
MTAVFDAALRATLAVSGRALRIASDRLTASMVMPRACAELRSRVGDWVVGPGSVLAIRHVSDRWLHGQITPDKRAPGLGQIGHVVIRKYSFARKQWTLGPALTITDKMLRANLTWSVTQ